MKNFEILKKELVTHLIDHALRTDGPFQLSSGGTSDWYLDGRQTTYDGAGGRLVGACVAAVLDRAVTAVGGLTMGADPVAIAAALVSDRTLKSFSIRKETKGHGTGGRLVGPVTAGDAVAIVDDTTTTGSSLVESNHALQEAGIEVVQAIVVVDRSEGAAAAAMEARGIRFDALVVPADLGVS